MEASVINICTLTIFPNGNTHVVCETIWTLLLTCSFTFLIREGNFNQTCFIIFQFQRKMLTVRFFIMFKYFRLETNYLGGRLTASLRLLPLPHGLAGQLSLAYN